MRRFFHDYDGFMPTRRLWVLEFDSKKAKREKQNIMVQERTLFQKPVFVTS